MGDDDLYQQGEDMRTIVALELPFADLAARHVEIIDEIMVAREVARSEVRLDWHDFSEGA